MARSDRGRISYVEQLDCSLIPSNPVMQIIPVTGGTLSYQKSTVESAILDSSAQPSDSVKVGAKSAGSLPIEWSADTFDDFLEAGLRGTFDAIIDDTGAHVIAATAKTITGPSAGFTNAKVGQWILLSGFVQGESYAGAGDSTNNGWFEIKTVTSSTVLVLNDPLGRLKDETGPATAAVKSKRLINGVEERCYAIEQGLLDVGAFFVYTGQRLNSLSMSLSAGQIVTGEFAFQGSGAQEEVPAIPGDDPSWIGTGSYTPMSQSPSFNATDSVGLLIVDESISPACFKTLNLTVNNNVSETPCIGQEFPRIDYGTPTLTGSLEKVFTDPALWRKMRDHATVSMQVGLVSNDGESGIHISVPEMYLTSDVVDLSGGKNSDVADKLDFSARKHTNAADETYYAQVCCA